MELRFLIISVAFFSCLVPYAFSTGILKTKAAAVDATKGAALLGAKALMKEGATALVTKTVAAVVAKGALIKKGALAAKGVALIAAKSAALKGAITFKESLINSAVAFGTEVMKAKGVVAKNLPVDKPSVAVKQLLVVPPPPVLSDFFIDLPFHLPLPHHSPPISIVTVDVQEPIAVGVKDQPISDTLSARAWGKLEAAAKFKSKFLGGVIRAVHDASEIPTPAIYDLIEIPRVYTAPYIDVTEEIKQ